MLNNVIIGAATIANSGAGSNGGNALIDFGSQQLTSFTFNYGNAATAEGPNNTSVAQTAPVRQVIALHDINFVPEPGSNALLAAGGLLAGGVLLRRRARR